MKKTIILALVLGIAVMFGSPAIAKKEFGKLPAPENLTCGLFDTDEDTVIDSVCFTWDPVDEADKYSVDVDVEVDTDGDGVADVTAEFSFGTGDRTDELSISNPSLCVPLSEFVLELDDGTIVEITGPATAKVKGLKPGKGNGRQNNPFSTIPCEFLLE